MGLFFAACLKEEVKESTNLNSDESIAESILAAEEEGVYIIEYDPENLTPFIEELNGVLTILSEDLVEDENHVAIIPDPEDHFYRVYIVDGGPSTDPSAKIYCGDSSWLCVEQCIQSFMADILADGGEPCFNYHRNSTMHWYEDC